MHVCLGTSTAEQFSAHPTDKSQHTAVPTVSNPTSSRWGVRATLSASPSVPSSTAPHDPVAGMEGIG